MYVTMKYYSKLLCMALLSLVTSVIYAQSTRVTILGPQTINMDDPLKGSSRVYVEYTGTDGSAQNSNQDVDSWDQTVGVKPGTSIQYRVEHKSNYAFLKWKLDGFEVSSAPSTNPAYTETTFTFPGDLFKNGESVKIGLELIQQYSITITAPTGINITATYPSGSADDKPLTVAEGASETVRINKGGSLNNLVSSSVKPGATATTRTIFNEWIESSGTSVFGLSDPFNVNDYNSQTLPVNGTGANLATNAVLTVKTEDQIKVTLKAPVTVANTGDPIGGTFGEFSYYGSPLNENDDYSLTNQSLAGQSFTTDQFFWIKDGMSIQNLTATPAELAGTGRFMFYTWLVNGASEVDKKLTRNFTPAAGDEITPVFIRQYKMTVTSKDNFTIDGSYLTTTNDLNTGAVTSTLPYMASGITPVDFYVNHNGGGTTQNLLSNKIEGTGSTRNSYISVAGSARTIAINWTGVKTNIPGDNSSDDAIVNADDQTLGFDTRDQYLFTIGAQKNGVVGMKIKGASYGPGDADNTITVDLDINRNSQIVDGLYWVDKDYDVNTIFVTPAASHVFTGFTGTIYDGLRKTSIDADKKFVMDISGDLRTSIIPIRTLVVKKPVSGAIEVEYDFGSESGKTTQITSTALTDLTLQVNDGSNVKIKFIREDYTEASTERYFFKNWTSVPASLSWINSTNSTSEEGLFTIGQDVTIQADLNHQFKLTSDATTPNVFDNGIVNLKAYIGAPKNTDEYINASMGNTGLSEVSFGAGDYVWIQEESTDVISISATSVAPYKFLRWTGNTNAAGIPVSAFSMPAARILGALFVEQYNLAVTCPSEARSIEVDYFDGHEAKTATVVYGAAQTLLVNVATNVSANINVDNSASRTSSLKNWVFTPSGVIADDSNARPLTFTMPAENSTLTAELSTQYRVNVYVPAQGTGSLSVDYKENGIEKSITATYGDSSTPAYYGIWADAGTYPKITALPVAGYGVEAWKRSLTGFDASTVEVINDDINQFVINNAKDLEVSFERQYKLTVNIPDENAFFRLRFYRGGAWQTREVNHNTSSSANSFGVTSGYQVAISAYTDRSGNNSHSSTIDFVEWTGALLGTNQAESNAIFYPANPNPGDPNWDQKNVQGFSNGGINTIVMNADRSVGALFQVPTRKLVVNEIKNGAIRVDYTYAGINKNIVINEKSEVKAVNADAKKTLTLTITPDANYSVNKSFINTIPGVVVTDEANGVVKAQFMLNEDITLSPVFNALFGELTVEPFVNGTISLDYTYNNVPNQTITITPTSTERIVKVDLGSTVTFTTDVTAYPNYEFAKWIGNVDVSNGTLLMNAPTEAVGVLFRLKSPSFTIAKTNDDNRIKVEYVKDGVSQSKIVDNSDDVVVEADVTSSVTMIALPAANQEFVSWTGMTLDNNTTVSFVMNDALAGQTVTANFREGIHKVTVEAPVNGSLKVSYSGYNTTGGQTTYTDQVVNAESGTRTFDVIDGTDVVIDVVSVENYVFASWKDGNVVNNATRTFANVIEDFITGVLFINVENNLVVGSALDVDNNVMGTTTVIYTKKGAIENANVSTVSGDYNVDQSTKVQLMAKAEPGYEFISWAGVPSDNRNATIEVAMDGSSKSITPNFRKQTRSLTVNAPVNGSIQVTYMGYITATSLTPAVITEMVNAQSGTRVFQSVLGEDVTADHTADRTYQFVTFTGFDNNETGFLTVDGDETVGVTFANQVRTLTLDAFAGQGNVKVEYFRLGEVKTAEFSETTPVRAIEIDFDSDVKVSVLENTVDSHYRFTNWTGAEFGNNSIQQLSFLMNSDKLIGAKFEKITHKLVVEAPASGYIKVVYTGYNSLKQETSFDSFVNAESGMVAFDVVCDTEATLEAVPVNDNYSFVNWTGAPIDGLQPDKQMFNVDKDYTVGAVFKLNTYELTVTKPENGRLKVEYFQGNVAQQIVVEAAEAKLTVDKSSEVKVQVIADSHYDFVKWTGNNKELNNTLPNVAFMMEANAVIGADFRKTIHNVTVQAPVNGSIEVSYKGYKTTSDLTSTSLTETVNAQSGTRVFNVVCKEDVALTAIPDLNYSFLAWSGTAVANPETQVLTSVDDDHTVGASFDILKRNLIIAAPVNGTIEVEYVKEGKVTRATASVGNAANLTVDIDTYVKLEAKDAPNFDFVKWIGDITDAGTSVDKSKERIITFRMDDHMRTISSLFRAETRKLTAMSPLKGNYTFKYYAYVNDESADTEEREIVMRDGEGGRDLNAVMFTNVMPLERVPATNYTNVGWTNGGYTDMTPVSVAGDMAIGAAFALQNRILTIEKPVNGQIKVEYLENNAPQTVVVKVATEVEPETTVDLTVDLASNVKITAMADADYDFVMWKNAVQFANVKAEAVEFLMENNKQIGSYFRKESRKLTAHSSVNGSYSFSYYAYANENSLIGELRTVSMPAGSGLCEFEAVHGTSVTAINRTPATNYQNDAWTEAFENVADGASKIVSEPLTIGARFKTIKHNLEIAAPKFGQISVDYFEEGLPVQETLTEGQSKSYKVDQGSTVLLSAAAIDNYDFVIWKGDAQFEKMDVAAIQLVMDAPKSVNSLFRKETRKLTAQSPINGEYEFSYTAYKNDNTDVTELRTIKLTELTGQRELAAVLDTEVSVVSRKAYMNYSNGEWIGFGDANKNEESPKTIITNDLTIGTLFTLNNRNLTITRPVNGSVKVEYMDNKEAKSVVLTQKSTDAELSLIVDWASNVKLTAIPDEFYNFLTWKGKGFDEITANHVEFMMESQAETKIVTAIFRRQTRDLVVTNPLNGKIQISYDFGKEEGNPRTVVIVENKSKITTFQVDVNSVVEIVPIPVPVPGYLWKNTYLNDISVGENNTNEYVEKDGEYQFSMDNSKTFVVNFKPQEYIIQFESNNGTSVADVEYTIEDEVIFAKPTRAPYFEFAGWYDNAQFTGNVVEKLEKGETGNRKYYANWVRSANDLSIGRMWSHTLVVTNPAQDPLITNASFKWYSKDEAGNYTLLDNGGKSYVTFSDKSVPNGTYKVEIYLNEAGRDDFDNLPIVIEDEVFDAEWRVYPTRLRTGESVNIETGLIDNSNFKVGLFTQAGMPVPSQVVETGNGLRVENIGTSGMYLIRVARTDGKVESYKIVVSD